VIADPGLARKRGNPTYESGLEANAFCRDVRGRIAWGVVWPGWTVFPDFTAPHARKWWSERYAGYIEQDIAGFWHDMNEPSTFVVTGDGTLPLSTRHDLEGRGGDHRESHNVYGLMMNKAGFDGISRLRPGRRPYMISRAGYAGIQRYTGTWTGDIGTSWEGLEISLNFTVGLGMSGMPYSGPDIGGFDQHPEDELYVRWFQLAAYLPFFRVHCAAALPFREPWAFGPTVLSQIKPALFERYELLPYWYTLAFEAGATGAPYVRPMLWADPYNATLRWVDDQFMLGDSLLVAPILEKGARERTVFLPAGRWYDRATGHAYDGPGPVTVPAEVDRIPVLVRGGSVLPVTLDGVLTLEAYVPGPADEGIGGQLVADEGDGDAEPVRETFRIDGPSSIAYEGPAERLPYPVRWIGHQPS
jgi:alpha-glucosidase